MKNGENGLEEAQQGDFVLSRFFRFVLAVGFPALFFDPLTKEGLIE